MEKIIGKLSKILQSPFFFKECIFTETFVFFFQQLSSYADKYQERKRRSITTLEIEIFFRNE